MAPNKEVFEAVNQVNNGFEFSQRFEEVCGQVYEYALTAESQQLTTTAGTVFGAYNAITGYYQNVASFKSGESKMDSLLLGGTAQQRSQKAFDLCTNANQYLS
jgi:hypothetical protein